MTDDWPQADSSAASLSQATIDALAAQGALARAMPAFKAREGQQSLAASVARAIAQRSSLVAEAGTGTGKTFAYLVPLLLSGARAMISTGTRPLQDQLFHRDLPSVKAALGLGTRIALLKGRVTITSTSRWPMGALPIRRCQASCARSGSSPRSV